VPKKPLITWGDPPAEKKVEVVSPTTAAPKRTAVKKVAGPSRVTGERDDVCVTSLCFALPRAVADGNRYSEMRNATEERGTYMDQLNDSLNNASVSATNYLQQARNQAMKEAAKSTVKGVFGKIL
jgi:hypothetical protein